MASWPSVLAALQAPPPAIDPTPCASRRVGSHKRDLLRGSAAGDFVVALRGHDVIRTLAGEDCLSGGGGNDWLDGGTHRDSAFGGPGADRLAGSDGPDRLVGNGGRDTFDGGTGADFIDAADHVAERVRCGRGRYRVLADRVDRLFGCERVRRPSAQSKLSGVIVGLLGSVEPLLEVAAK